MVRKEATKKLIVIKPNGNHSNRLIQNAHFEVFCKEYQIEYHNSTFSDLAQYYIEPCHAATNRFLRFLQIDLLGQLFHHSKFVKKVFSLVWIISRFGMLKLVRFDRAKGNCVNILLKAFEKNDVVYVGGWAFRVPQLVEKYKNEMHKQYALKPIFYLNNDFVENVEKFTLSDYIMVGVHIRRGDYKTWKKGAYYYEDEVYKNQMESISDQLMQQGKKKILFILFSNEALSIQQTPNLLISKENWYIDHHLMSLCHYLIGPPSTFTLWASYVGNAKLIYLQQCDQKISI
ncbi:MAG: hypothetical protein AUK44_10795 [Porphyromonadaceae bacterium CG2_30_38_12]|nr:MAG: hypothetical protein AUK44_10795 [Porphyromonadaceae bacterium CG2_30_38_12]